MHIAEFRMSLQMCNQRLCIVHITKRGFTADFKALGELGRVPLRPGFYLVTKHFHDLRFNIIFDHFARCIFCNHAAMIEYAEAMT